MSRSGRWNYMGQESYNPPNLSCPECTDPSRVFHRGAKTVEGAVRTRYMCEHQHEWVVWDPPRDDDPDA